jgi:integrase
LRKKIGLREVRVLQPDEIVWDAGKGSVSGFGARRQRSSAVSYIVVYRNADGRQRWQTIGKHGSPWTPETARDQARKLLGLVAGGADPAEEKQARRKAATVADLCDLYFADAQAGRLLMRGKGAKKASTLATDKGRIERFIKPALGGKKVAAVTREDVDAFMHAIAEGRAKSGKAVGGKGAASRTVGLLGAIFSYSVRHRMRSDNPVRGVVRFPDGRRDRRLSDEEYRLLGDALRDAQANRIWPDAIAAARFLSLTGWRLGEALGLRWAEVDLARRTAVLDSTKTGRSMRPLARAAVDALRDLPRSGDFVFRAMRGGGLLKGFWAIFGRVTKLGGLPADVTAHVLRHSFASLAADLGFSEPTIAALIGHKGRTVTSRYVHSADAVLLAAADAVADKIMQLMGEARSPATVVALRANVGSA